MVEKFVRAGQICSGLVSAVVTSLRMQYGVPRKPDVVPHLFDYAYEFETPLVKQTVYSV